jgi:hypothetical protein
MAGRWRKAAVASQTTLLVYFQMCMWLPLGAWNNQHTFPVLQSPRAAMGPVAIGLGTVLLIIGTSLRIRPLMWVGAVGHFGWWIAQALTIWPPYIWGASERYAAMYDRVWGRTTKVLPSWGEHLAPDGMHVFIQALLVAVLVTTIATLQIGRPAPFRRSATRVSP